MQLHTKWNCDLACKICGWFRWLRASYEGTMFLKNIGMICKIDLYYMQWFHTREFNGQPLQSMLEDRFCKETSLKWQVWKLNFLTFYLIHHFWNYHRKKMTILNLRTWPGTTIVPCMYFTTISGVQQLVWLYEKVKL